MRKILIVIIPLSPVFLIGCDNSYRKEEAVIHPNVLFIAVDDLNDWIEPLGGHPQTITPQFQPTFHLSSPSLNMKIVAAMIILRDGSCVIKSESNCGKAS